MELVDYLKGLQAEIRDAELAFDAPGETYPYPELVFADKVMQHMAEFGMTFEPQLCHYEARATTQGAPKLRLSGYSFSETDEDDAPEQLDLFVSLYKGVDEVVTALQSDVQSAANQCMRFLQHCVSGKLDMDETNEAYPLLLGIKKYFSNLEKIRIFVITDMCMENRREFAQTDYQGKTVQLEIMDIQRLFNRLQEHRPRDEILINFADISGTPLPCVWVPGESGEYDYALTAIPAEALRYIYDKYGSQVLEANVRSFLSATGKINKGIRDSLRLEPERFMAYNNGVVLVAEEIGVTRTADGSPGIHWLKGMQIVNGGQTTASIYFTKRKFPDTDLSKVRVPAKLIILHSSAEEEEEDLISNISRYANSQNAVKASDLSANHPFHTELEAIASRTYCPDGVGRWYYERSAGSYKVMLEREGKTPAGIKKLQGSIPPARKITKTDLAKYLNTWSQKPHFASLGGQKNFNAFMEEIESRQKSGLARAPSSAEFKQMIAQAILFKSSQRIVRPLFPAFQGNVTIYTLSILSQRIGGSLDLDMVWQKQGISPELSRQIEIWSREVNEALHRGAAGRMISEWAKKLECWWFVRDYKYSELAAGIPELKVAAEVRV